MRRVRNNLNRRGLTLIELSVVLAIISMMTAVFAFRFAGPWSAATIQQDREKLVAIDEIARREAIAKTETLRLEFDFDNRVVELKGKQGRVRGFRWSNHTKVTLARSFPELPTLNTSKLFLTVSPLGITPTYAIKLETEGHQKWLLFLGQSGQMFEIEDKSEMESYFDSLQK